MFFGLYRMGPPFEFAFSCRTSVAEFYGFMVDIIANKLMGFINKRK